MKVQPYPSRFSQCREHTSRHVRPKTKRPPRGGLSEFATLLNVQTLSGFIQSALTEHKACPLVAGFEIHLRPEDPGDNTLIVDGGEWSFDAKCALTGVPLLFAP